MEFANTRAGVIIPGLQSMISGSLVGLSMFALAVVLGWEKSWAVGLLAGAGAMVFSWFHLLRRWQAILEAVLEVDIDMGDVQHATDQVRVIISSPDGRQGSILDLPIDEERLIAVSSDLTNGTGFSHALAGPGRALSRAEYEALRDEFIRRGLARWVNPRAHQRGLELSPAGRSLVKRYAALAGKPPTLKRSSSDV